MARVYVGLDAASTSFHWMGKDREGSVVIDRKFLTSEKALLEAAKATTGTEIWVHLEASELAGWIRMVLRGRVARVIVSDPKASAWISKDPRKNDRLDADKLSDQLRLGLAQKHEVYYPDDQDRMAWKQLVQHYDEVTRQQGTLQRKIKARLRAQGVIAKGVAVYDGEGRQKALKLVRSEIAREAIGQLFALLDRIRETQAEALKLLKKESQRYPEVKLLDTVPGVALILASRFSAYVQTPHRFSNKRKFWSYCRMGIAQQSSDDKPLGRMSLNRNGVGALKDVSRKAFEGAMKTRENNAFKRFFQRSLKETNNETHARLSTQRKILAVMRAIWIGGTPYQDDKG
jgi:transposase